MSLDEVAEKLYRLTPGEFIKARSGFASEAKADGDKELASNIGRLRKPSVSAWLVNLLVHEHPDQIDDLMELGVAMRTAQEQLSGPEMRRLSTQRNEVVTALVRTAAKTAYGQGQSISEAVRTEAGETLQAALADPDLAAEVRVGHLSTAVTYSGFGPDILVQRSSTPRTPKPSKSSKPPKPPKPPKLTVVPDEGPDPKQARAVAAAEAELERSQEVLVDARAAADTATAEAEHAAQRAEELTARVEELRRELSSAQKGSTAADREQARLERRTDTAAADVRAAERRVKQATSDLARLT